MSSFSAHCSSVVKPVNAIRIVRTLLEAPEGEPDAGTELTRYAPEVAFSQNIRDILQHARFLRQQAEEAGALSPRVIGDFSPETLDRAFLQLACETLVGERRVSIAVQRLKKHMHHIW